MQYSELVEYYERLEATTKKLEKRDILSELYKHSNNLEVVAPLSMGVVFPAGKQELGIAREMIRRVVAKTYGVSEDAVVRKFKETGDLGSAAEFFSSHRRQISLAKKDLTVDNVFGNLRKLPDISGKGSQERKIALVSELLSHASPEEAKYIVRTVLGDMRVGVAAGIVRDAISVAFGHEAKEVEHVFNIIGDYGKVAEMAKRGRLKAELAVGSPVRVMLAERSPGLKEALEEFENAALEWKYDGFRTQISKDQDKVKIFSRRMEDVTNQFPDIVKMVKENIRVKNCIIEGEALAIKDGKPQPFQTLSKRIQRKYDIEEMVKEIPVQVNLFDLIYCNGENYMQKPFRERWNKLRQIIKETKYFRLADHLETKDLAEAEKFYKSALKAAQEGVIVKNLDAKYQPGKRVGYWLKVKEILEPLDLVVVGAEWGEGKRAKWLGSMILAAKKGEHFVETGRMASGLTEEQMEELTKKLRPLITDEEGKIVKVRPRIVLEIGYEEIQKSPKYPSGYALRFPRLLRIRDPADKKPEDANTVHDVEKFFKMQKRRK